MRSALLLLGLFGLGLCSVKTLWPLPTTVQVGGQEVLVSNFTCLQTNVQSDVIAEACDRYNRWIFPVAATNFKLLDSSNAIGQVAINVQSNDFDLQLGIDESYSLAITTSGVKINAGTIYGALHALETLSQCIDYDPARHVYAAQTVTINDSPRYPWRGLLVDTARHFLPLSFLKSHVVEALAMNKMNTLHLHIVDAQSWPLVVPQYPLLSGRGAYAPEATYTAKDIADLVEYARRRGVRVVPEIDVPGHSYAIGQGYPDLVAHCPSYEANVNNIPVDPTKNATYEMLRAVIGGLVAVCPDKTFHTGGDELVRGCWSQDASIMKWCSDHGIASTNALEGYFEQNLQRMLHGEMGRTMVVWEEPWLEKAVTLDQGVIVEAWRSIDVLHQIVASGHPGILAAPWYLDKQIPSQSQATHYEFMDTWQDFYTADPGVGSEGPVPEANANLILGGEACMWAEQASFDERVWPRSGATAERLWSPAAATSDLKAAAPRLDMMSCRMKRRGIHSGPIVAGTYCPVY
ncbi:putative Beta-hexosaminidase subunit A1 [Paratrimastix pyriformis]|uniref:Beta-hexosaminidase n=1 Tax=Paratrimastix pyriformis TaxID=342808 RepID=A0ABQ8UEY4_9EUKA|nr:putative Beta-hexosaminidase subunit A1 [Paratrimastix pyriformis]